MPNVADEKIAWLESQLANVPPEYQNTPQYLEAQRKLDLLKGLNDNPVSGALIDQGVALAESVENLVPNIANATLDVIRGLGGAIVDGLDSAYDAARGKLEGKQPDVIAGIVVVTLTILTGVYLFHSAKNAMDAF